jgi:hypothetical protein
MKCIIGFVPTCPDLDVILNSFKMSCHGYEVYTMNFSPACRMFLRFLFQDGNCYDGNLIRSANVTSVNW